MKERILEFLKAENKSSAQLADEIGVQPSGISHILSGRNNPSLDFVLKMLEKYQFISTDWLLFGKGAMYKDIRMQSLFDESPEIKTKKEVINNINNVSQFDIENQRAIEEKISKNLTIPTRNSSLSVKKIVWFYDNNSFEEFFPNIDTDT